MIRLRKSQSRNWRFWVLLERKSLQNCVDLTGIKRWLCEIIKILNEILNKNYCVRFSVVVRIIVNKEQTRSESVNICWAIKIERINNVQSNF